MTDGRRKGHWDLEARPSWNGMDELSCALRDLSRTTQADGDETYHRMLYAVGNNHAGTYHPMVLAAVPSLGAILRDGGVTARLRTLEVLIDLIGSFEPEPAFEVIETAAGDLPLKGALKDKVLGLTTEIEQRRVGAESPEEAQLAQELLDLLREELVATPPARTS